MTSTKFLIYGICGLTIFNYVIAEEESSQRAGWQFPSISGSGGFNYGSIDFPSSGGLSGSGSGSGLPFSFPRFGDLSGLFGRTTTSFSPAPESTNALAQRKRREADDGDHDEHEHSELQSRLFFSKFPIITSCNYTTQSGSTCLSCRQALNCLPNNVGLLTNCAGLFRYCNNGHCSLFQGSACSATTSTSSSSSTSSTSNTSSSTSTSSSTTTSTTPSG